MIQCTLWSKNEHSTALSDFTLLALFLIVIYAVLPYTKSIDPEAKSVNGTTPMIGGIDENMNGSFLYRAGLYEYYNVTYWQPEEGIILYDYSLKKLNAEEVAYETLLIFLLVGATYSGRV